MSQFDIIIVVLFRNTNLKLIPSRINRIAKICNNKKYYKFTIIRKMFGLKNGSSLPTSTRCYFVYKK